MDNMNRDKVEHYYQHTTSSSLNIWNDTWNPHKEDPVAAEHNASRYQNDKLMQYKIGKTGP
jgi:hypothetical protein